MDTEARTPVLIAGGGPVGLSLALELGWRGVPCILVEQGDGTVHHPKVGHISVRTMEHARRWGIVEAVRNCGFPPDYVLRMVYCTSMTGYRLCSHEYPSMAQAQTPPETPEKKQRCPQLWFDPILLAAVRRYAHVKVLLRCRLEAFEQDEEGVTALLVCDNGRQRVRAQYLAACDGAGSGIRRALDVKMLGDPVLSRSVAIYIRAPGVLAATNQGDAERYTFIGPEGTWGNLTVVDGKELWRLTVFGSRETVDLERFDASAWVRRCLGTDTVAFDTLSVLPWRRSHLVAERYRVGRVFLLGDAAHTMSPTGGFGMNTGIGDAVDLGWKLEGVYKGWAGAQLLDSYDAERRPIGERNVSFSTQNYRNLVSAQDCGEILSATPEGAAARARIGEQTRAATRGEYETLGVLLGYRYESSPICIADGTPAPADCADRYVPTSRPGARAPHAWIAPRRSTLDEFGREFVLMRFADIDVSRIERAADKASLPFRTLDIRDHDIASLYERKLVLVRPDGHVAWRADEIPPDCAGIINRVRGSMNEKAASRRAVPVTAAQ